MTPWELLAATFVSSVVGSLHCVGMCSPFALLAVGAPSQEHGNSFRWTRLTAYHLGRLTTYLTMGLVVVLANTATSRIVGPSLVVQALGYGVGGFMVWIGAKRLLGTIRNAPQTVVHSASIMRWTSKVVALRKRVAQRSQHVASFVWGLSSTLLPCGWLYLFVMAAAVAPDSKSTLLMLIAFWLGTLPLLSLATWTMGSISLGWQKYFQPLTALIIIAFGCYTLIYRANLDLMPMRAQAASKERPSLKMISDAMNAGLPCCKGYVESKDVRSNDADVDARLGVENASNH